MSTLPEIEAVADALPPEQQEMLAEILHKRQIEGRRNEIAASAREAIEAFQAGELKPQTADEVIADLRGALQAPVDS